MSPQTIKKLITRAVIVLVVLIVSLNSYVTINTGTVGVVKHFGAVENQALSEGFHFVKPFITDIVVVPISMQTTEAEATAASKDLQGVHTKVTVQWAINAGSAPRMCQTFGYGDGVWTNGIIAPALQEVVKAVSARYTAEQLITQRHEVKLGIEQGLLEFVKKTLAERGAVGAIRIVNVAITNFSFSKEFDQSIEAKVRAEQDSLRAKNEKEKRITEAEAAAKEATLAADALAYKTEVESKARSAAIERESKALESNPNLIQLRIAERWDGKLPHYTGSSIPLLQLKQ
jgi:regulator of protease activity HflC (stomatin/prohibitin superfamily)